MNGQHPVGQPTGTDFYPERAYRTYVIPTHIANFLEEAMMTCRATIELTCNTLSGNTPQVIRNELMEAVFVSALQDQREYLNGLIAHLAPRDSELYLSQLKAAGRDDWKCVLPKCGHTQCNSGGTHMHHILPRYEKGPLADAVIKIAGSKHSHRNLATLCQKCHGKITNPTEEAWKWRNQAPTLYGLIGEPELEALVRDWEA